MTPEEAYQEAERRIEEARRSGVTKLDLHELGLVKLPEAIGKLTHLRTLHLMMNHPLSSLPDTIGNLNNLQELYLSFNQLSSLSDAIANLTNLQTLNLSSNQLSSLPDAIGNFTKLRRLDLSHNQLSSLPDAIGNLTNLQELFLRANQLSSLPDAIGNLTKLKTLELSLNQLSSLPDAIGNLTKLQTLHLDENQLSSLPDAIGNFTNLRLLDLYENQLSSLPDAIGNFTNLRLLNLNDNQLSSLPDAISQLKNLKILILINNLLPIPPEIIRKGWGEYYWVEGDPQAVIAYYLTTLTSQKRPFNEAKVLLVGQGTVGKTSLVQRLLNQGFNPHQLKTEGIAIQTLDITLEPDSPEPRTIKLNLWDFGGQEIMHATHQFFLTKRSLYLLVLNNRQSEEENRLEYWLNAIESFGSDSPVIIVGNQSDQHPLDLDERGLRKKYPNIKAFIATSCKDGTGIEQLQQAINREINQLKHVSDPLPGTWFQVKEELENLEKDYIPYDDYAQICEANQIPEDQTQRILVSLLHDLGIILNFHDDPLVSDTHVINPEWVTTAIYKIINDPTLMTQDKGILTYSRLNQILPKPAYPNHKHQFIIAMMKKFELCFAINDQQVLIPNLLPKEAPATLKPNDWNDALRFQYHYGILPQSVISRFIVKMHQRIDNQTYWRSGVVLISEGNRALITADLYDKKIFIAINGTAHTRRDFLSEIRGCFFSIHDSFARLPVEEKVPLPKQPEIVVSYKFLKELEAKNKPDFPVEGVDYDVNVSELLSGVDPANFNPKNQGNTTHHHYYGSTHTGNGDIVENDKIEGDKMNRDKILNPWQNYV